MSNISYTEMLEAVSNGKYSADRIATICSRTGLSAEEVYNTLYYSDNISFFRTSDGTVRAIQASTNQAARALDAGDVGLSPQAQQLLQELNSNAQEVGVNVGTNIKTPMNTYIDPVTGKVKWDTEIAHIGGRAISDGKFSANTVGLALAAVGAGIAAGKKLDSVLYARNPDFFDSITWGDFNPEHWSSITADIDENDPLYVRFGAAAINAIMGFGVDDPLHPENMQMYLDEDTIAYMLMGLSNKGVFSSGQPTSEVDTSLLYHANYYTQPIKILRLSPYIITGAGTVHTYDPDGADLIYFAGSPTSTGGNMYFCKDTPFTAKHISTTEGYPPRVYEYPGVLTTSPKSGKSCYIVNTSNYMNAGYIVSNFPDSVNVVTGANDQLLDCITFYGYKEVPAIIDGISNADGATAFDPSNIDMNDTATVIAALRSQFPDLFNDDTGIEQKVVDENGQEKTITYYPIPVPHIDPDNTLEPTGGEEYGTQTDPIVDPATYPEALIKSLTEILLQSPTDNPNLPDTGNGNTPVVTSPAGSATALWSIYNPTQAQINSFGAWLWSNDFVDQLKKIFNDPMESIISLHKVFGTPATGGAQNIAVGYLNSGVSSKVVTAQYTDVDCGSVQLSEYFGNVYDYKDTSVELYLPFIGIVPLSVYDVMRATIHIVYHIDVLTGACLADVEVVRDAGAGGVLYQYSGDCAVHYPVSSGSYIGIVGGILSAGAGIAGTIASGGAVAPLVLGGASALMRMHTDVARSGGFSANAGAMGAKVPYLIISRPQTALPDNYLDIEGIGSNKTVTLNTCAGYTRVKEIYLQGVGDATEGELNELETLLKAGVIFPITETPPND